MLRRKLSMAHPPAGALIIFLGLSRRFEMTVSILRDDVRQFLE
jgi:hypothetical protein